MQTTIRVSKANRDALSDVARRELGGVSLDEALRIVLFEHQTATALARLSSDPDALDDYRDEAKKVAETDAEIHEW